MPVNATARPALNATISRMPKTTRCNETAASRTTSADGQGMMPLEMPSASKLRFQHPITNQGGEVGFFQVGALQSLVKSRRAAEGLLRGRQPLLELRRSNPDAARLRHLLDHGCRFVREGGRHSWWENPAANKRSSIPRHTEVNEFLARKAESDETPWLCAAICKDLEIPAP